MVPDRLGLGSSALIIISQERTELPPALNWTIPYWAGRLLPMAQSLKDTILVVVFSNRDTTKDSAGYIPSRCKPQG